MRTNSNITVVGLSVSAVLAMLYVLLMLVSLFLVGLATNRSLQATLLGIGWSTLAGFEIGLLWVVIVGFAIAGIFVPVYNTVRRWMAIRSKNPLPSSHPARYPSSLGQPDCLPFALCCLRSPCLYSMCWHWLHYLV